MCLPADLFNSHYFLMKRFASILFLACILPAAAQRDAASWVNPMIGTGGHGHTFPGAVVPFGMIQPGPDTRIHGWDGCSGYHYTDSTINGFAQTHLSGTGCADYGDFLFMPVCGRPDISVPAPKEQTRAYASPFSHARETAQPGYYAVDLDRYGIRTEISATARAAIYRFTFPACTEPTILLDVDYSIGDSRNLEMDVKAIGDRALEAFKRSQYWAVNQPAGLYAEFSEPFTSEIVRETVAIDGKPTERLKMLLRFKPTKAGQQIMMRLGFSHIDAAGAKRNLAAEIPHWDFDRVRSQARDAWNAYLGKIAVDGKSDADKTIFYTALYHTGIAPNLYSDTDGRHRSMSGASIAGDPARPEYTVFSLWDTYRALHPLLTIIDPNLNNALIRSLLTKHREGGILPMWELSGNYTATMTGYHAVSLMADAITKGIADFDVAEAYAAARRTAGSDTTGIGAPRWLQRALMPASKVQKNSLGWIPWNIENESVAKGLEYAYDDWCVARIAEAAGDTAGAAEFDAKSRNYRNYFDPTTRFMRGKDAEGRWHEPFHPRGSSHRNDDYCEGTAWQWSWYVPQDVPDLISMLGGREAFVDRLDSLFTADSALEGGYVSSDISGMIGQYAHGNEPSHHIVHLYNYAGRPDRTQELVRRVMDEMYREDFDGLEGNEDCGQMSAWYVLNALGLYQVCPGEPTFSIGAPRFDSAVVALPGGKRLEIIAENLSPECKYVEAIELNGRKLTEPFISYSDLMGGGKLRFQMTSKPAKL